MSSVIQIIIFLYSIDRFTYITAAAFVVLVAIAGVIMNSMVASEVARIKPLSSSTFKTKWSKQDLVSSKSIGTTAGQELRYSLICHQFAFIPYCYIPYSFLKYINDTVGQLGVVALEVYMHALKCFVFRDTLVFRFTVYII